MQYFSLKTRWLQQWGDNLIQIDCKNGKGYLEHRGNRQELVFRRFCIWSEGRMYVEADAEEFYFAVTPLQNIAAGISAGGEELYCGPGARCISPLVALMETSALDLFFCLNEKGMPLTMAWKPGGRDAEKVYEYMLNMLEEGRKTVC